MFISIKVLTLMQAFLLVAVCCVTLTTLVNASQNAIKGISDNLQKSKVMNVEAQLTRQLVPVVGIIHNFAMASLQDYRSLLCFNVSDEQINAFMLKLLRLSQLRKTYPYFYMTFKINKTYWGECNCGEKTCDLYFDDAHYYYNTVNATTFNLSNYDSIVTNKKLEDEGYVKEFETRPNGSIRWGSPDAYFDVSDNASYLIITLSACLDGNATHCTRFMSCDVDLNFISQILNDLRTGGQERILLCDRVTGAVLASSIPHEDGTVYSFGVEDFANDKFWDAEHTPDPVTNGLVTAAIRGTVTGTIQNISSSLFQWTSPIDHTEHVCATRRITVDDGVDWFVLQCFTKNYFMYKLWDVLITSYILVGVCTAVSLLLGVVIMRSVLGPLQAMSAIFRGAAQMNISSIVALPKSFLSDVVIVQRNVDFLVEQLKEFRKFLPEAVLLQVGSASIDDDSKENKGGILSSFGHGIDSTMKDMVNVMNVMTGVKDVHYEANVGSSKLEHHHVEQKFVTISLTFVARDGVTVLNNQRHVTFDFEYVEGMPRTLERLASVCREFGAGYVPGQSISLQFRREAEQWSELIQGSRMSDMDFFMAAKLHRDNLECRVGKHGKRNVMAILRCTLNVSSLVTSILLVRSLLKQANPRTELAYCLVGSLAMQILTNLVLSRMCLFSIKTRTPTMCAWFVKRKRETFIGKFLAVFNVLSLEIMAAKFTTPVPRLSFHAPFEDADLRMMERYSIPGFVLGSMMTLLINVIDVYINVSTTSRSVFHTTYISLVVSTFSTALTVMRLVVLTSFDKENAHDGDSLATIPTTLTARHVSLLRCVLQNYNDASENAEEMCNEFYDIVFHVARLHFGVVTKFEGGDVTILFNGTTDVEHHETMAAECAFAIMERKRVCCAIVSDVMKVGNLGTSTRRAFQHISPSNVLCQSMAELAVAENCPILVTQAVADACPDFMGTPFTRVVFLGMDHNIFLLTTKPGWGYRRGQGGSQEMHCKVSRLSVGQRVHPLRSFDVAPETPWMEPCSAHLSVSRSSLVRSPRLTSTTLLVPSLSDPLL